MAIKVIFIYFIIIIITVNMRTKAISPIVSTILLVVVVVILMTVVLYWGKDFTNKSLETTNPILKETSKNYMVGSVELNAQGVLSFKNITPGDQSMTITGYKSLSTSDDEYFNTVIDIEDVTILPGTMHIISIPAFPPDKQVTIQLITDDNEYISVGSIRNIPEEQQNIPEPEPEIEPLTVAIFSPTDSNVWYDGASFNNYDAVIEGEYVDFNSIIIGGNGVYDCSWNLKTYDRCFQHLIQDYGIISNSCNFNMQITTSSCILHYYELTVSSDGVENVKDGIVFLILNNKLHCPKCSPPPV